VSGRSRSTLFLLEQLIVITIFAVCASVCVKIFIESFLIANKARDINHALSAAKNAAECFKIYGDPGKTAAVLSGREHASGVPYAAVYYDAKWRVTDAAEAAYVLRLRNVPDNKTVRLLLCEISVKKITGEELIRLTVAARLARFTIAPQNLRSGAAFCRPLHTRLKADE